MDLLLILLRFDLLTNDRMYKVYLVMLLYSYLYTKLSTLNLHVN